MSSLSGPATPAVTRTSLFDRIKSVFTPARQAKPHPEPHIATPYPGTTTPLVSRKRKREVDENDLTTPVVFNHSVNGIELSDLTNTPVNRLFNAPSPLYVVTPQSSPAGPRRSVRIARRRSQLHTQSPIKLPSTSVLSPVSNVGSD